MMMLWAGWSGSSLRFIVGGLFLSLCIAACAKKQEPPKARPPVPVTVAAAATKTVPVELTAIGNGEASSVVSIKSQVSGTVVKAHFVEGEDVKKGEVLFTIDKSPFLAALRQAEAVLSKDQAQARNAEEQASRYAMLVKDGIVTKEQYDTYRTTAEALMATVAADRAAVENARIQLEYCTIRSPITGRTGNLAIHTGNVVKANETVLVNINQIHPIYVSFTVPENQLSEIKRRMPAGLKVKATVPSDPEGTESGIVTFLDNSVDPATGMFKLKGSFPNKTRKLWPGQFVNVVLTLSALPNAIVVPQQAVQTGQKGQYVFVVKNDGTVDQRPVVTGISYRGETVIQQGLAPNETVVTDGQMRLVPGAKIEIRKSGQGGGSPAMGNAPGSAPVPGTK